MKKFRTIVSLILVCATVMSCMVFGSGAKSVDDFKDLDKNADYYAAVEWAVNKGIMAGTSNTAFSPDMLLTRAQLAQILAAFSGDDLSSFKGSSSFSDVSADAWYCAATSWAAKNGIMAGTGNNMFTPNKNMTRQEAAVMLKQYVNGYKQIYLAYENKTVRLMDRGSKRVASWASEAVNYAYRVGYITVNENDCFRPTDTISRADAAVIFYNLSNAIDKTIQKTRPRTIAYINASEGFADDEFTNIDILNIHPAKADGASKTIQTSFISRVTRIRAVAKAQNPDIKCILTLTCQSGANIEKWLFPYYNCDDFAEKVVAVVDEFDFDGVDFDYEFPTGDVSQQNLQYFLTVLRQKLDALNEKNGTDKDYLITMALGGGTWSFDLYSDLAELQHYVDFFNFMDYDLNIGRPIAYNHAAVYSNPASGYPFSSTYDDIVMSIEEGLQRDKIVIGAGIYSNSWINVQSYNNVGLFCPGTPEHTPRSLGQLRLMINYDDPSTPIGGYYTYWDDVSKSVSLYNPETRIFLSFDDDRSVEEKCKLVREYNIGGIMFFDYINVAGATELDGERVMFFDKVNTWLGKD